MRVRLVGAAIIVSLAILALLSRMWWVHDPVLAAHDSLVTTRPATDSVIREHADSGRQRIKIVYVQQDDANRRELIAKQSDSLAQLAIASHDFELAYHHEKDRADTLQVALDISQKATENAIASASFNLLAYLADSTALQAERRNADAVAHALRVERRPKCGARCGVLIGVGFTVAAAWSVRQLAGR